MTRFRATPNGNVALTVEEETALAVIELENAKQNKASEIRSAAEVERDNGFTSSALGTAHVYGSTLEDRINLIGAAQAGQPTKYNATENGQRVRKQHTPAQMQTVLADGFATIQTINDKESGLLDQIDAVTTRAELNLVVW